MLRQVNTLDLFYRVEQKKRERERVGVEDEQGKTKNSIAYFFLHSVQVECCLHSRPSLKVHCQKITASMCCLLTGIFFTPHQSSISIKVIIG